MRKQLPRARLSSVVLWFHLFSLGWFWDSGSFAHSECYQNTVTPNPLDRGTHEVWLCLECSENKNEIVDSNGFLAIYPYLLCRANWRWKVRRKKNEFWIRFIVRFSERQMKSKRSGAGFFFPSYLRIAIWAENWKDSVSKTQNHWLKRATKIITARIRHAH